MVSDTVFTDAWAAGVFGSWSVLCNAQIEIYTPGARVYNSTTGDYTQSADTTHWSGRARVAPVRSGERNLVEGDDSVAQSFRVQIPRNSVEVTDVMRVRVTDGGLNEFMPHWDFHIRDFYNQSGAFEQTFIVTVNSGR